MWVIFTVTGARLSSPSRIWPPSSWPRGPALNITLCRHSADCLLSVLPAMLIRVAAHKNQARTRQLYHYIQYPAHFLFSCPWTWWYDEEGISKLGHFNQNLCPPGSWLSEESEKCARKYLLVRKYLLSTVSAAAAVLAVVSCRLPSWVWLISRLVGNYKICFVSPLSTKPETGPSCGGEGRCSIMSRYISSM